MCVLPGPEVPLAAASEESCSCVKLPPPHPGVLHCSTAQSRPRQAHCGRKYAETHSVQWCVLTQTTHGTCRSAVHCAHYGCIGVDSPLRLLSKAPGHIPSSCAPDSWECQVDPIQPCIEPLVTCTFVPGAGAGCEASAQTSQGRSSCICHAAATIGSALISKDLPPLSTTKVYKPVNAACSHQQVQAAVTSGVGAQWVDNKPMYCHQSNLQTYDAIQAHTAMCIERHKHTTHYLTYMYMISVNSNAHYATPTWTTKSASKMT